MNENRSRLAKVLGVGENTTSILRFVSKHSPINQQGLKEELETLLEKSVSKPGISKKCKTLVKKNLVEEIESGRSKIYTLNETTLERLRKDTLSLEFGFIESLIANIPSDGTYEDNDQQDDDFLREEEDMYNQKKWKEAIKLLDTRYGKKQLTYSQESKRQCLLGWCYYYLGLKKIEDPKKMGEKAKKAFIKVLRTGTSGDINSALSGLPLVYFYLIADSKKAFKFAEKATGRVYKGSILNTQGLLKKEEGLILESLKIFSEASRVAQDEKDFRISGNALNNKARALMTLLPAFESKADLKKDITNLFNKAIGEYKKYEKATGVSARFHKEGITQKIKELGNYGT